MWITNLGIGDKQAGGKIPWRPRKSRMWIKDRGNDENQPCG